MRRKQFTKRLLLIISVLIFTLFFNFKSDNSFVEKYQTNDNILLRKLFSKNIITDDKNEPKVGESSNCTTPAIQNFPTIPKEMRNSVIFLLFSALIVIYFFIGTALMCDHYFVPSLEVICDKLNLESDIAGSTFMAAGSSAPELAASLIGVMVAKDDIGVGTVVGSAVFNIAFVISVCALFAGRVVCIDWWPIVRDSVFYLISICLLFVVMFDTKVSLIESIVFLLFYLLYILFMVFNKQIESKISPKVSKYFRFKSEESSNSVDYSMICDTNDSEEANSSPASDVECIAINSEYNYEGIQPEVNPKPSNRYSKHLNRMKKLWNYFIYPLEVIHRLTVVDCTQENRRNCFVITFIMSCVWISFYSYIIVWMITLIGFNLRIPDTVMGLIFIAGGASIPDAISSLIVVRQGLGNMALTNAIGSNVFDILVCLGLPWLLQTAIIDPGSHINVISRGLEYSTFSLISTVVFFLVATHLNGWKLTKRYGLILMIWYLFFISLSSLYELNVFGQLNPPICWNSY